MCSRGKANNQYQGSKWITRPKRLAIYTRDGMACVYCGNTIEDGATLSLDHIFPYSSTEKPDNHETNLVTCCKKCNSSRGNRALKDWCKVVAEYINNKVTKDDILEHITDCISRDLDVKQAKEIMAHRGSWSNVIKRQ